MVQTTIPYDAGWIVTVDGKKVATYATIGETLLAFDIADAGNHTVELRTMPKIYVVGGIASVVSVATFVTVSVFESKRRKKKPRRIFSTKPSVAPLPVPSAPSDATSVIPLSEACSELRNKHLSCIIEPVWPPPIRFSLLSLTFYCLP